MNHSSEDAYYARHNFAMKDVDLAAVAARHVREHLAETEKLLGNFEVSIASFASILAEALTRGNNILWCGNGGSAADSQHLAAELVGRFRFDRRPLASIALSSDTSVLTCVANDFGYEKIFSRQVEAFGRKGDVLVAISTSGNSKNVLEAVSAAKSVGMTTVGLLGSTGGALHAMVDHSIRVPSSSTARIQEMHILVGHIVCDLVEIQLGFTSVAD